MLSVDGGNNIHGLRDRRTVAVLRRREGKRSVGGGRKALSDSALKVGGPYCTACTVPVLL